MLVGGAIALVVLAGVSLAAAPAAFAQANPDITGRWATDGFEAIVDLEPCANDASLMCGRILWLWDGKDLSGQPRKDIHNPDRALRSRSLVGVELLHALKRSTSGRSFTGSIYNPDDGRTYTGTLSVGERVLELKGCALGVFCDTEIWHRPADVLAAAGVLPEGKGGER